MAASSEIKTKPTQHSVKELRSIGIQPDVLVCRSEHALPREQRAKIALFTNVEERAVISAVDVDDIYKIPMLLAEQGLDSYVVDKLKLDARPADLSEWQAVVDAKAHPEAEVTIAMVGKYVDLRDSYMSLTEALRHAGIRTRTRVNILYMESEEIQTQGTSCLNDVDAILVPGGFGERGIEGKIAAVKFAREKKVPYLGICLGLQVAVIEYARNVVGLAGAHSTELNLQTPHPVIAMITEWQDRDGSLQERSAASDLGGTMRLGAQTCYVKDGTLAKTHLRRERGLRAAPASLRVQQSATWTSSRRPGLVFSGFSSDGLVELIELPPAVHPWFFATQFHPGVHVEPARRPSAVHELHHCGALVPGAQAAASRERMRLAGFEVGLEAPLFLIAGPCVIESEALVMSTAERLKTHHGRARDAVRLQSVVRQSESQLVGSFRGLGAGARLADTRARAVGARAFPCSPTSTRTRRSTRSPPSSTCCKRRRCSAGRRISSSPSRAEASP